MGRALGESAQGLACSERTLRRYINDGLLRGRRLDRYHFELSAQEERYARSHWALLHGLRAALRTERDVRLAVLFGSTSTGDDAADSDVDLLVVYRQEDVLALSALSRRLSDALGRRMHIVRLQDASRSANLLADILAEGRVVIDRDGIWSGLLDEHDQVLEMAMHEDEETLSQALACVDAASGRLAS
jgi:predicted nucleotidyltransferase